MKTTLNIPDKFYQKLIPIAEEEGHENPESLIMELVRNLARNYQFPTSQTPTQKISEAVNQIPVEIPKPTTPIEPVIPIPVVIPPVQKQTEKKDGDDYFKFGGKCMSSVIFKGEIPCLSQATQKFKIAPRSGSYPTIDDFKTVYFCDAHVPMIMQNSEFIIK